MVRRAVEGFISNQVENRKYLVDLPLESCEAGILEIGSQKIQMFHYSVSWIIIMLK
jgi:hypothetical protein